MTMAAAAASAFMFYRPPVAAGEHPHSGLAGFARGSHRTRTEGTTWGG